MVDESRARATTAFGWVAGICGGVLASYGLYAAWSAYPTVPGTFVLVAAGGFAGMRIADRIGERGFRTLGLIAGTLIAATIALTLVLWLNPSQ